MRSVRFLLRSQTTLVLILTSMVGVSAPAIADTLAGHCFDPKRGQFAPCNIKVSKQSIKLRFRDKQHRPSNLKIPRQKVRGILLEGKVSCRLQPPTRGTQVGLSLPLSRQANVGVAGVQVQYLVKYAGALGAEQAAYFCLRRREARGMTQELLDTR